MENIIDAFFESIAAYIPNLITLIIVILVIQLIFRVLLKVYKTFLNRKLSGDQKKIDTYYFIIKDAARYIIYFIYLILFLQSIGISSTVLVTSVGAVSVIIGIAGQAIIMDIFNGFFVIFDNYYTIGDYIKTDQYEGYVEDFKIRSTFLRTFNNEIIIIPNSNIQNITNFSKLNSFIYQDLPVAYEHNINDVENDVIPLVLERALKHDEIISLDYLGVGKLGASSVDLKMLIYANPENRFIASRILYKEYKKVCEELDYEIPYTKVSVVNQLS